eukprot:Tbor_TRINITY_DN3863_c0_g1::TRINITY_DN3863_c0_g1_i1::g.5692::m.5692
MSAYVVTEEFAHRLSHVDNICRSVNGFPLNPPVSPVVTPAYCNKRLFYISAEDNQELIICALPQSISCVSSQESVRLPGPCVALHSYRHILYCICPPVLVRVDPLSVNSMTSFMIPSGPPMSDIRGVGAGLVLCNADGSHLLLFMFDICRFQQINLDPIEFPPPLRLSSGLSLLIRCGDGSKIATVSKATHSLVDAVGAAPPLDWDGIPFGDSYLRWSPDSHTIECLTKRSGVSGTECNVALPLPLATFAHLVEVPLLDPIEECVVCYCELDDEPSITLSCGHAFHVECLTQCLSRAEDCIRKGEHITFGMAKCPAGCGELVRHPLAPQSDVTSCRMEQMRSDALSRAKREVTEASEESIKDKARSKTMDDYLYYLCDKCKVPFFGGEKICVRMSGSEPKKDPSELLCGLCDPYLCSIHHTMSTDRQCSMLASPSEITLRKCRFCCNPATGCSFGCYYYCDKCDELWEGSLPQPTPCDPLVCPLGGRHGDRDVGLGCIVCDTEMLAWDRIQLRRG